MKKKKVALELIWPASPERATLFLRVPKELKVALEKEARRLSKDHKREITLNELATVCLNRALFRS